MGKRSGAGLGTVHQAARFLGYSVLAGVVAAGIALPAVGALGLTAKGTASEFNSLPDDFKAPTLSQATRIEDSNGGLIATVYSRDRKVVPLKDVNPVMLKAIVDIEDSRYWKHGAIDPKGILRALNKNAESGGVSQGGSTLTQQYVKNVFIEEAGDDQKKIQAATSQTLGRKIREMKYAIELEKTLGKKKILENYLNIVPFGEQAFGIEVASERYFSTSAKNLTLDQAAMLAGLVNGTSLYDPIQDPAAATKRRNVVLQRMADLHDITQAQADAAAKKPLGLKVTTPKSGCITAVEGAGFFCDYVRNVFLKSKTFGKTADARQARWDKGGLTIRTTLDPKAQQAALNAVTNHIHASDEVAGAVTLVQPGTGKVLAMAQSRPYGLDAGKGQTQINFSVDKDMGGGEGLQPGSTFKAFTAAAALEAGYKPSQSEKAPYSEPYPTVTDCKGNVLRSTASVPNEDHSEHGPYTMPKALQESINTYFVSLEAQVGLCPVQKMVNKLGITHRAGGAPLSAVASFTLGVNEMAPLDMADAYAAFAARGTYCSPVAIESVTDAKGKSLKVPGADCHQVMSQNTADTINTMLKGVVDDGTGTQAGLPDRDTAGKTGTTDGRYSAWFVGYTPDMAAAVAMGDPNHHRQMVQITIGGQYYPKVYGATGPAPIWRDAVSGALAGSPPQKFNTVDLGVGKDGKADGGGDNGGDTTTGGTQGDNGGGGTGQGTGGSSPTTGTGTASPTTTGGTAAGTTGVTTQGNANGGGNGTTGNNGTGGNTTTTGGFGDGGFGNNGGVFGNNGGTSP
jgi:membrane peptidoglycan carboxypeptidase